MIGIAQRNLDAIISLMLERKQFEEDIFSFQLCSLFYEWNVRVYLRYKKIIYFQEMQNEIAQAITDLKHAKLLIYDAAIVGIC